jgi:hypothetical protein
MTALYSRPTKQFSLHYSTPNNCSAPFVPREDQMQDAGALIAVFEDHRMAEMAVRKLIAAGFDMKRLSVVGKGYRADENSVGFYNVGDRIKFWGERGEFWGGLWGLFSGGLFMTVPVIGHVVVVGYLVGDIITGVESAVLVGGLSAIGAGLHGIGVPAESVIQYEAEVRADGLLVMAHGPAEQMLQARSIQAALSPLRLDLHSTS